MNDEDLAFLANLKEEFCSEALDTLVVLEGLLVKLDENEQKGNAKENLDDDIDKYKAALHLLIGSAEAVDLKKLSNALHKMEDWIMESTAHSTITASLDAIETMREYLEITKYGDENDANQILDNYLSQLEIKN